MKSSKRPTGCRPGAPPGLSPPPAAGSGRELNGAFLHSYDPDQAEPDCLGAPAWQQRRHAGRGRGTRLVLQATEAGPRPRPIPELILDDDNLLPFHFLRTGDRIGRAVVKIRRADGAAGTGFLVAPGVLLTNHHVLPDPATAAGARVYANFEVEPPPEPAGRVTVVAPRPEALFVTDAELDFTFCGVEGLDDLGCVPLERDSLNLLPAEFVNIVQHPRGRPKEVALQDNRVVKVDNVVVHYSCDTEPGSSGSPVFNNQWQLVALHHASVVAHDGDGFPARGADPAARYLNEGIRISAIAVWLETHEPVTLEGWAQVARLRGIFGGLDPQVGFFGALGRRPAGRSTAEAVVECYHDDDADLDLAFWDLSAVPDLRAALTELGWIVASMRVDAWCLTAINRDVLRALCLHLETHFRLDYDYILACEPGGPPVALLFRRPALLSAEWLPAGADAEPGPYPGFRLRIRAASDRGRTAALVLVPVLRDGRRAALSAVSPDPDAELLFFGDGLGAPEIRALADAGVPLRAAVGPEGAFALISQPDGPFGTVFASPNLASIGGSPDSLIVAHHRAWPEALGDLGGGRPIVLRLTFTAPPVARSQRTASARPTPHPTPEPTYRPDPPGPACAGSHLEQALREILARFEAAARHLPGGQDGA